MTYEANNTVISHVLEQLLTEGSSAFREALESLLNEAMLVERARHLGVDAYERSAERRGHSNGFKPKQLKTTLGPMALQVPQVRDSDFYPSCLEKGSRVDRTLLLTLAEMYVKGVSTRKVSSIVTSLCGMSVNSTDVSRATQKLDDTFKAWRERDIGQIR